MPENDAREVTNTIAASLARLEQPDLAALPPTTVWSVVHGLLTGSTDFDALRAEVAAKSGGAVRLEEADEGDFPFLSKELGARYVRLVGPAACQLVIVGNSNPQFLFVPRE